MSKILIQVLKKRIIPIIGNEVLENKVRFREGKEMRDGIFQLKQLSEKIIEKNESFYITFLSCTKTFDKGKHQKLIEIESRNRNKTNCKYLLWSDCSCENGKEIFRKILN